MKPKIDLYGVLGMGRDADEAAIRKAYRSRAKHAHPDAGGSPDEFRKLSTAHLVLSDPEKRAKYDETGSWDEAAPQTADQRIITLIGEALMGVVQGDGDPVTVDLVAHLTSAFRSKINAMRQNIAKIDKSLARTKKLQGRFRSKKKTENRIEPLLQWQERNLSDSIAKLRAMIADHEKAIEFLNAYEFEAEAVARTFILQSGSTSASTFGW
jgi:curved DNA-binding protein CbpA